MIEDYDNEDYDYFKEWDIERYKKEIERLHSIIKEVREYIEKGIYSVDGSYVLKILDKENK